MMTTFNDSLAGLAEGRNTITPQVAAAILAHQQAVGFQMRPVRRQKVEQYKRDMVAGRWRVNGEPIVLGPLGELLQGQHRLTACSEAGSAFDTVVFFGQVEDYATFDCGAPRSVSDALRLIAPAIAGNMFHSAARLVMALEDGDRSVQGGNGGKITRFSTQEVVAWCTEHADELQEAGAWSPRLPGLKQSASVAAYVLASRRSKSDARIFFKLLGTGESLAQGSSILTLRNSIVRDGKSRNNSYQFMLLAVAWNAFRESRPLRVMKPSADFTVPDFV
jgi:hypothetical protein